MDAPTCVGMTGSLACVGMTGSRGRSVAVRAGWDDTGGSSVNASVPGLGVQIGNQGIQIGVRQGRLVEADHLLFRPCANRMWITDDTAQTGVGQVLRWIHRQAEVGTHRARAAAVHLMTGQTLRLENFFAAAGRTIPLADRPARPVAASDARGFRRVTGRPAYTAIAPA